MGGHGRSGQVRRLPGDARRLPGIDRLVAIEAKGVEPPVPQEYSNSERNQEGMAPDTRAPGAQPKSMRARLSGSDAVSVGEELASSATVNFKEVTESPRCRQGIFVPRREKSHGQVLTQWMDSSFAGLSGRTGKCRHRLQRMSASSRQVAEALPKGSLGRAVRSLHEDEWNFAADQIRMANCDLQQDLEAARCHGLGQRLAAKQEESWGPGFPVIGREILPSRVP